MNENLDEAARITVVFVILYVVTFVNIAVSKKRLLRLAHQEGKVFDRYESSGMQTADRLQGNILEWSPIFLGLVWSLASTSNLSFNCVVASWMYLVARAFYIVLVLNRGVAADGVNSSLWISTTPAYACLLYMMQHAIRFVVL